MIVSSPPLEMSQQVWGLLSSGPGTASQSCHSMTNSEIHPLDESGVESSRKTHPL